MEATVPKQPGPAAGPRKRGEAVTPVHLRADVFADRCSQRGHESYAQRADYLGLDPKTIWRLCNHKAEATISTAVHIARELGCPVEALFAVDAKCMADLTDKVAA